MADDKFFHHIFIAVPELMFDDLFIRLIKSRGYITPEGEAVLERFKKDKGRVERILRRTKKYSTFTRIMAIAPEIMTSEVAELLHRAGRLSDYQYQLLRRTVSLYRISRSNEDAKLVAIRSARLLGLIGYGEVLEAMEQAGMISVREKRQLTIFANSSTRALESFAVKSGRIKSVVDLLLLGGSELLSPDSLRALKIAGVINPRTANALAETAKYGSAMWTVFEGAKRAEGLAARMAYVVSGSFSWEALDLLFSLKRFDKRYEYLMKVAVAVSQQYNRRLMEQLTQRRFRVLPGETPLATFARSQKASTASLTRLLAAAAKESARDAKAMKGLSADQRKIRTAALHRSMRELWEGVGHLTIFGEAQAAEAAIEAMANMQRGFRRHLPSDVQRMLNIQAKSGIDAYISRQENRIQLSRRVYGNMNLFTGKVDKRINIHLLKGSSAEEIAKDISRFISPSTPGGVSYAAMRLGRTELANAFHTTTIRNGREMPWVQGMKWNLSGSHGRPDICNQLAEEDRDNLGAGVYKKSNIPGKPHPQCLCYLTMAQVSEEMFIRNMNRGFYDRYMRQMMDSEDVKATMGDRVRQTAVRIGAGVGASIVSGQVQAAGE